MTATHLTARLRSARIMARSSDSPAVVAYWLQRAADLSRELGLVVSPFEGFATAAPAKRELCTWVKL
jgi:hypothetical protein